MFILPGFALWKYTLSFFCLPFFPEKYYSNIFKSVIAEKAWESLSGSSSAPLFATKERILASLGQ